MPAADDCFKQPGAVPFKWEILPGVPKPQLPPPSPSPTPQKKLSPPPASFHYHPTLAPPPTELRTQSFRSAPRARSDRWRFGQSRSPEVVSPAGCFPTSPMTVTLPRRKDVEGNTSKKEKKQKKEKKEKKKSNSESEPETDYGADLIETLERWSVSTRKSFSLFRSSPLSAYSPSFSFSSRYSSPRPATDTEWGGFGLF